MIDRSDISIEAKDMRVGMGVAGWHMRHTYTHEPTGTQISFETQGSQNTFQLREDMIAVLDMMVDRLS